MTAKTESYADPMREMVPVHLPKIPGEHTTVFVGINGRSWQIPRGKTVEVPKPVADMLKERDRRQEEAERSSEQEQEKLNELRQKFNV